MDGLFCSIFGFALRLVVMNCLLCGYVRLCWVLFICLNLLVLVCLLALRDVLC